MTPDMDRCPACNTLLEWRTTLTGMRVPIEGHVLIHGSGPAQVLNHYGVIIHSAKVVKEGGEVAYLLHRCLVEGRLSKYREIGGGRVADDP